MHVEGDVGCMDQQMLVRPIVLGEKVAVREAEEVSLSNPLTSVTGIVRCDFKFLDLMKPMLTLAIAFEM